MRDVGIDIWSENNLGAHILLVSVEVVKEIEAKGGVIGKVERKVRIRGLGEGQVVAWEKVLLEVKVDQGLWLRQL